MRRHAFGSRAAVRVSDSIFFYFFHSLSLLISGKFSHKSHKQRFGFTDVRESNH